jgi:CubicO group peptidase (beta-lactamase class C family)
MRRGQLAVALMTVACCGRAAAQPVSRVERVVGDGRAVHQRMLSLADSGFSGAVIVERNDTLLLAAGYGLANRERKIPFSPSTIAQVGSITKQFTATAIADLAGHGRLRYGDSLATVFPDVPAQARGITIDQLLSHTSGLPDDCGGDFMRVTKAELLHRCLEQRLVHAPGGAFAYSNLGYSVLGAVVEQVAGVRLETYLRDHFFAPLGLVRTGYFLPGVDADSFAVGYGMGGAQANIQVRMLALDSSFWNLKGNGGIQSTVDEMYRWYHALRDGPVITDEMRKALFSRHAEQNPGVYYGYGWFVRTDSLGRTTQVSHSGSDGVFIALWYWRPIDRVFIYTVSNFGESDLAKGAVAAIRRVLGLK